MPRKIEQAGRCTPLLHSNLETASELRGLEPGLTPKETARVLRVSTSYLAKARVRGDGPPYTKMGRSVRYFPSGIGSWLKSRQRSSTSE